MDAITLLENMTRALATQVQLTNNDPSIGATAEMHMRRAHLMLLDVAHHLQNAHGWQITHLREQIKCGHPAHTPSNVMALKCPECGQTWRHEPLK